MELNIKEPKDINQLDEVLKRTYNISNNYQIRVENNILATNGKWLLKQQTAQDKRIFYEGFSGIVNRENNGASFKSEVRKLTENYKGGIDIDVKQLLYASLEENGESAQPCVTLSFASIMDGSNVADFSQWKEKGFTWCDIEKIDRAKLTPSTSFAYGKIRQEWDRIKTMIKPYSQFNQKMFEQYFFYGMENRQTLLEGIIYYTNEALTEKYLALEGGERFPSTDEKIEIWKRKAITNYAQLYKFLNIAEGEDTRFDFNLDFQERKEVEENVEAVIQNLIKNEKLLFFKRGIFYKQDAQKEEERFKTFDVLHGFTWAKDVYTILQQLGFMERRNYHEYYGKWLQAKISRLRISGKYPPEKLEELQDFYVRHFENDQKREKKQNVQK